MMAFSTNPLSLSVPDTAFESWLRDSGYLEILDQHSSSSTPAAAASSAPTAAVSSAAITGGVFVSLFSRIFTFLSLFIINPLSKLTTDDFSGHTPSWTHAFFADSGSYSFPSGPHQARLRVQENVKRYARNYVILFVLFFACTLYQMPLALIGLIASLAIWDIFKYCSDRWRWDRYPTVRQVLVHTAQCVTAVILMWLNVQMALFCALGVSYVVMILHAAFRKLTSVKKPSQRR